MDTDMDRASNIHVYILCEKDMDNHVLMAINHSLICTFKLFKIFTYDHASLEKCPSLVFLIP